MSELEVNVDLFLNACNPDPLAPNYHNARKLKAAFCLGRCQEAEASFHLSEATAGGLRTMAIYRHEQLLAKAGGKMLNVINFLKPIENIIKTEAEFEPDIDELYPFLRGGIAEMEPVLREYEMPPEEPFHVRYLRFSDENNVDNFLRILDEFPEEWTVVQLTSAYSGAESTQPPRVHRAEVPSLYVSVLRNAYTDAAGCGPLTVELPANVAKEGERPLLVELHSLLDANLQTIENASRTYTQKTIHKYWEKRQDTDLRMMSVIKAMDKEWLGAWRCLLTGKPRDRLLSDKVRALVDRTCDDWGFIRFTTAQKVLLCNLLEASHHASSDELRRALVHILTRSLGSEASDYIGEPAGTNCPNCSDPESTAKMNCQRCKDSKSTGKINCQSCKDSMLAGKINCQNCEDSKLTRNINCQSCKDSESTGKVNCQRCKDSMTAGKMNCQRCKDSESTGNMNCQNCRDVTGKVGSHNCRDLVGRPCLKCLAETFKRTHRFSLADGIRAFMDAAKEVKNNTEWEELRATKRHPVILIVDETLDTFPWESCPSLLGDPVSRMESVHMLYSLYKTHENDIVEGHLVLNRKPLIGRYVINPDNNLERMEKRISSFVSYWCPEWSGRRNQPPEPQEFLQYLRTCDLFLYCGHGDGCQYACGGGGGGGAGGDGAGVEGAGLARAVVVLSGCGSVRLQRAGGRAPPAASHYQYHIAGSPMVVGMLWEVTDMEVDKVVTTLLALAVPSAAPVPWDAVGKAQWSQGALDLNVEKEGKLGTEPELLRAVAKARRSTSFLMISSSIVARGLPVLIQE